MSAHVLELKELLARRFPDAVPVAYRTAGAVATGIDALDGLLPDGGLPRGRLTVWAPGGGATALLRAASEAVVARGERAVWVDAGRVVAGEHWRAGPLLVRPEDRRDALACAEELVRSGGFALVVLSVPSAAAADRRNRGRSGRSNGTVAGGRRRRVRRGTAGRAAFGGSPKRASRPALSDAEGLRFVRGAREGAAAMVLLGGAAPSASLRLSSRIRPEDYRWLCGPRGEPAVAHAVRANVRALGMGWNRETEVPLSIARHEVRLSLDSDWPDRRGVRV